MTCPYCDAPIVGALGDRGEAHTGPAPGVYFGSESTQRFAARILTSTQRFVCAQAAEIERENGEAARPILRALVQRILRTGIEDLGILAMAGGSGPLQ